MQRFSKSILKKFSTLIIPDPNKYSSDVLNLMTASEKFQDKTDILHLTQDQNNLKYKTGSQNINKVYICENSQFDGKSYEASTYAIEQFIKEKDYKRVIMSNSFIAKEILPRLAIDYNAQGITDIVEIIDKNTFLRPIYAGNAISKVRFDNEKMFLGVRVTNFEKTIETKNLIIEQINSSDLLKDFKTQIQILENVIQKSERPELTSAWVILSGGRALKSQQNFELLNNLADCIKGSAVGASRAAVDAGYVSNDLQIGQTGKIVAPDLYIAFGISGAIQHVAGIKDSKVIVAINKNKEEAIFQIADYGLVGDIFKIIPEMIQKLK